MLIRTKLKIIIYLSVALASISSVAVFYSFRQMEQKLEERREIHSVVRGIFDLNILASEYLIYQEKRPLEQWNQRYSALSGLIEIFARKTAYGAIPVSLRDDYRDVKVLFSRLIDIQNNSPIRNNSELTHRLENHLQSQILTKNHELVTLATRIEEIAKRDLLTGQKRIGWIVLALILSVSVSVIGVVLFINKSVVLPFEDLMKGVRSVGKGNLDVRIDSRARDEIGMLSSSFDHMVSRLKEVMVSRSDLQEEVTQRKQAEEKLKKEHDFISAVLSTAGALVVVLDREGRIVRFNRACEKLTGYSPEEVAGKLFWNVFLLPEDIQPVMAAYEDMKTGNIPNAHENRLVSKTGDHRLISWANTTLVDGEGRVEYVIGTGIDISEKRHAEEALQDAASELGHRVEERTAELKEANRRLTREIEDRERLNRELERSLAENQELRDSLKAENIFLKQEIKTSHGHGKFVGQSQAIKGVLVLVDQVAKTDSSVLIQGETGTGKELIAHEIHNMSSRRNKSMVKVNCAALPPTLIENELFGREKGAYTGAISRQVGRFEIADGSTLFLDEIGELPIELQGKILRVLEEGKFERLGASSSIRVDVRIIAATNRDLKKEIQEGRFRDDLFYRLNVFPIHVPPLRDRREDIPAMVWTFIKEFERGMGKTIESVSKKSMELVQSYPWPGNVRELRNVIERMMILCEGNALHIELPTLGTGDGPPESISLEQIERKHILSVLEQANWRVSGRNGAAEILGLKRTTLLTRMNKLGIQRPKK